MNANEFRCRAFLAAMGGHYADRGSEVVNHDKAAVYCGDAADAALAVAQRRGMVDGGAEPRQEPELERVEFTADRDGDAWTIRIAGAGRFIVAEGAEVSCRVGGPIIHIKWGETMPPKPIEVWIERKAGA